jgi:hypothetical protein
MPSSKPSHRTRLSINPFFDAVFDHLEKNLLVFEPQSGTALEYVPGAFVSNAAPRLLRLFASAKSGILRVLGYPDKRCS